MIIKGQILFLRSVLYLAAVIQSGTITEAAERNGIKAANLSRMIKDLEETVGTPLFVRKSTGMIPTQAALYLYEKAQQLQKDLKQVQGIRQRTHHAHPVVRLAKPGSMKLDFLQPYSRVRIKVVALDEPFHIGLFFEEPAGLPTSFQVGCYELDIHGLKQQLWMACQMGNVEACELYDFITSQLFP